MGRARSRVKSKNRSNLVLDGYYYNGYKDITYMLYKNREGDSIMEIKEGRYPIIKHKGENKSWI